MSVVSLPARAFCPPPSQNLMVGVGDHLRICDFGLAGECDKEKIDPWTGKEPKGEDGDPIDLICAPFTGGTPTYMSEEVGGLRRELAAATTDEDHRRIKAKKLVTAATADLVAKVVDASQMERNHRLSHAFPRKSSGGSEPSAAAAATAGLAGRWYWRDVEGCRPSGPRTGGAVPRAHGSIPGAAHADPRRAPETSVAATEEGRPGLGRGRRSLRGLLLAVAAQKKRGGF